MDRDRQIDYLERSKRLREREDQLEANRTSPDHWMRRAEVSIEFDQLEKAKAFIAMARYYRDERLK